MKKGEQLSIGISFAVEKHANQFDRGGNPYILHCIAVMQGVESTDEELLTMAILHDVIEDTNATYTEMRARGFTERVIAGVKCLTKERGESYDEYKAKVASNTDARKVKMSDLRHNSDLRRLKGTSQKDIDRVAKYMLFYAELQEIENRAKGQK